MSGFDPFVEGNAGAPNSIIPTDTQPNALLSGSKRNKVPLLLAKFVGVLLVLWSLFLLIKVILSVKHHYMIPATGGMSYNYNIGMQAPQSEDASDLESKVFQTNTPSRPTPLIDTIPESIPPAPGTTISPQDNPSDDRSRNSNEK